MHCVLFYLLVSADDESLDCTFTNLIQIFLSSPELRLYVYMASNPIKLLFSCINYLRQNACTQQPSVNAVLKRVTTCSHKFQWQNLMRRPIALF
jgi:hypothetical protein